MEALMEEKATTPGEHIDWHVLIAGLSLDDDEYDLGSGLTLSKLKKPLSIFDLAAVGAVGFREAMVIDPLVHACTCELISRKDALTLPGHDTLNRAWVVSALILFRGFANHLCLACSAYSWNLIAGRQLTLEDVRKGTAKSNPTEQLPRFQGGLLDFRLKFHADSSAKNTPFTIEDAEWVKERFDTANKLDGQSKSFNLASKAAVNWRYTDDKRAAVALLWSGIEAIFSISMELRYRLSMITAGLLAPRGRQRKAKFQAVKKLYDLRCKVVHGSNLKAEEIDEAMIESYELLKSLLLISVEKGHPLQENDFDEALFF